MRGQVECNGHFRVVWRGHCTWTLFAPGLTIEGMSYRTIKRVLGETNLERKCRWWFGTSLFILLSLSFFWYGKRTDTIVKELNPKFIGPELVRAGWLEVPLAHLADIGRMQRGQPPDGTGPAGGGRNDFEDDFYGDLVTSS